MEAVKRVLSLPRGTSGRIILELSDELELSNALATHTRASGDGKDALDAARYRWLRSDDIEVPQGQREISAVMFRLPFREDQSDEVLFESALDAAIDAAIAAKTESQGAAGGKDADHA